jgi:hypothetical protein
MIISHKHKFIYLRTPKTASSSVSVLLEKFCGDDDIVTYVSGEDVCHRPRNFEELNAKNHCDATLAKQIIGDVLFKKYFKFTCVRNPWDREVSCYWHRIKKNEQKNMRQISFKHHLELGEQWGNYEKFYKINEKVCMDDFIYFERLENDTKRILNKLNIKFDNSLVLPEIKRHTNPRKKHYSRFYNDATRNFVHGKYQNDIRYFEYRFSK